MKLELKHIAPYLPYGLKWSLQGLHEFTMTGLADRTLYTKEGKVLTWPKSSDYPQALFPILRPLTDLTEWNIESLLGITNEDDITEIADCIMCNTLEQLGSDFFMLLIEKHYDMFYLIDNKLAINMNTLNK